MARLNNRPSTVAGSNVGSETPRSSSDQENQDPRAYRDKRPRAMDASSRTSLPTPISDSTENSRGQKRKRVTINVDATQEDDIPDDQDPSDKRFTRYYDPNQSAEVRRQVKRKSRALQREFQENRDEFMKADNNQLRDFIDRSNQTFKSVKQTGDATVDSRLLVEASSLAVKKSQNMVLGDTTTGLDVDLFLSKCITYMRTGGTFADDEGATQTQRGRTQRDEDDEDDDAELDFEVFGAKACFPFNKRPACPSFLLGPLSVQKKVRAQTQRRARQTKDNSRETRPETLAKEDLNVADQNALTIKCTEIQHLLHSHVARARKAIERVEAREGELSPERQIELCKQYRVTSTGYPNLFDFVINPRSFGQTVENIFYVSFLIKEGTAGIEKDHVGMPTLAAVAKPAEDPNQSRASKKKTVRNQAVFSIDYGTWQKLVEGFDIQESLIPHREEEQQTQVGSRGWYA